MSPASYELLIVCVNEQRTGKAEESDNNTSADWMACDNDKHWENKAELVEIGVEFAWKHNGGMHVSVLDSFKLSKRRLIMAG